MPTSRLTQQQINQLVELLLVCPAMQDEEIRRDVVLQLDGQIQGAIHHHSQSRTHVLRILHTCKNYPDGLNQLIEAVRFFDHGTIQFDEFERTYQLLIGGSKPKSEPERVSLPVAIDPKPHDGHLHIFLCYASEDSAQAFALYERFKQLGCSPWMDKRSLLPGKRWQTEIGKAVRRSHVIVVCLSRHTNKTGFLQKEITLALDIADKQPEDSIFVIPVRLEECDVPERLHEWHWCNLFEHDGFDLLVQALQERAKEFGIELLCAGHTTSLSPNPSPEGRGASERAERIVVPPSPPGRRGQGVEGVTDASDSEAIVHNLPLFPVTIEEWYEEWRYRNEEFGKPAGYWCYVRPGTYRIGGWKKDEPSANITLPGFWVAKHPITVAQYTQFINDGGYTTQRWWTPNGWPWISQKRKQPWGWDDSAFHQDNQPVVGIAWYEATAFAAWLMERLNNFLKNQRTTSPTSHITIRLPTEAEWEAAAAYDAAMQRHRYPWGEKEPTPEHAIFSDKNGDRDHPEPVGERPLGAAACGAHDMAGNVCEVTTSSYTAYPNRSHQIVTDFTTGEWGVPWRGGPYRLDITYCHCAARNRYHPGGVIVHYCGVRLLLPS